MYIFGLYQRQCLGRYQLLLQKVISINNVNSIDNNIASVYSKTCFIIAPVQIKYGTEGERGGGIDIIFFYILYNDMRVSTIWCQVSAWKYLIINAVIICRISSYITLSSLSDLYFLSIECFKFAKNLSLYLVIIL